ncbi:MAG: thiamine-phosphate kinase [Microbacteriaceae bacterium]
MTTADTLTTLGERETLRRIFPRLPRSRHELLGPGDDAAVLAAPDGRYVVTTDMMIHGPDFRWGWSSPNDIGWKAAATNLSDVAAMGARPTALLVAIAAPPDTPVVRLLGIADGLRQSCEVLAPGCGVAGGDLSVSATFTVAVTAFGDLEGRQPVLRSGARPGDIVAVAGPLGDAGRGLRLLFERALDQAGRPDTALAAALRAEHTGLIEAQLRPSPPIAAGIAAAIAGASAMLDISDGLALDARRVAEASGVIIDFDTVALGEFPEAALAGGEDHGFLACFAPDARLPTAFRPIGRVRAAPSASRSETGLWLDGQRYDTESGWDPYRGWDGTSDASAHHSVVSP